MMLFSGCGCNRYINWAKDVFNQAKPMPYYSTIAEKYVRSARIYEQFTTLGIFDAIWLHDQVRVAYVRSHATKNCMTDEAYDRMLKSELDQNQDYISFYVLAYFPDQDDISLKDQNSIWSMSLLVDDKCYAPVEIKKIDDLPQEYKAFLYLRYTRFKLVYLVRFNAKDVNNMRIIYPGVKDIRLSFRRVGYKEDMLWCLDGYGNAIKPYRLDKNVLAYPQYCQM
jgi:hypothetical protein